MAISADCILINYNLIEFLSAFPLYSLRSITVLVTYLSTRDITSIQISFFVEIIQIQKIKIKN